MRVCHFTTFVFGCFSSAVVGEYRRFVLVQRSRSSVNCSLVDTPSRLVQLPPSSPRAPKEKESNSDEIPDSWEDEDTPDVLPDNEKQPDVETEVDISAEKGLQENGDPIAATTTQSTANLNLPATSGNPAEWSPLTQPANPRSPAPLSPMQPVGEPGMFYLDNYYRILYSVGCVR